MQYAFAAGDQLEYRADEDAGRQISQNRTQTDALGHGSGNNLIDVSSG